MISVETVIEIKDEFDLNVVSSIKRGDAKTGLPYVLLEIYQPKLIENDYISSWLNIY